MFPKKNRHSSNPDMAGNVKIRLLFTWMHSETKQKVTAKCIADFSDATTLNKMVDWSILKVPLQDWNMHPATKVQREKNTENALEKIRHAGIPTNLRVKDILKGDDQRVIQLLEDVFKFVMKSKLCQVMEIEGRDAYDAFRDWINDQLKPVLRIHNFTDYWSSGKALAGLVNSLTGRIPDWMNWLDTGDDDRVEEAMTIAEEYGVQKWLPAAHIVQCKSDDDATPNIIYLSQFLNIVHARDTKPKSINPVQDSRMQIYDEGMASSSLEGRQGMVVPMRNKVQHKSFYRNTQPPEYFPTEEETKRQNEGGSAYEEPRPDAYMPMQHMHSSTQSKCIYQPRPDALVNPVQRHPSRRHGLQDSFRQAGPERKPEVWSSRSSLYMRSNSETLARDSISREQVSDHADLRKIDYRPTSNLAEFWRQIPCCIQRYIRGSLEKNQIHVDPEQMRWVKTIHNGVLTKVGSVRIKHGTEGFQKRAVKCFEGNTTVKTVVDLLAETEMMLHFKHGNVLGSFGLIIQEGTAYNVMPLMDNGDLHSYLINNQERITPRDLQKFVLGVADGMHYLHKEAGYVHRNLQACHCLLDNEMNVKIFNFRSARETFSEDEDYVVMADVLNATCMPWRWMALEILKPFIDQKSDEIAFNFKTDVWQFAIFCWEVYSFGEKPYPTMQTATQIVNFLERGERLHQPQTMLDTTYNKIIWPCWYADPGQRPGFDRIHELLSIEHRLTGHYMYTKLQHDVYDDINHSQMDQDPTQANSRSSDTTV